MTGGRALVGALEGLGVELAFGLPGVHNLAAWAALAESDIRLVGVRHEQTAVYAADGAARATGRLGVALTTTGPGAANTLAATGEAWASGSPVLVIATDIATGLRRPGVYRGVLHETRDQGAMFAPVVKDVVRVRSADELGAAALAASRLALAAPSGPVYLEIPSDLLSAPAPAVDVARDVRLQAPPADHQVAQAAALCARAERPLIWAGGGAVRAGARDAVQRLAAVLGAPVLETYAGRGLVDPAHPCWVGLPPHVPEAGALWDDADLVVAIGSDLDGMTTQNWLQPQPRALVAINVDAADATKNYRVDVVVEGDAAAVTAALAARLAGGAPAPDLAGRRERALAALESDGRDFVLAFGAALDPEVVVFADMCIPGYWLAGFHPFPEPRKLAYPMGWGTLGFGFPASIGAALAQDAPTLCVCGDGGFLFAAGELATVAQERVPLTILLWDDGGYGMLRYDQRRSGDEPFGVDLATPDWVQLAASFGIAADRLTAFDPVVLREHLSRPEPSIVVVEAPALTPPPTTSPRWYRKEGA